MVGRSASSDIQLDDPSVSRRQLELTRTGDGRFYAVSCSTSNPTRVWRSGEWQPLRQGFLEPEDRLTLGGLSLQLSELIARLPDRQPAPAAAVHEPISVRPRRKSTTGEVELAPSGR